MIIKKKGMSFGKKFTIMVTVGLATGLVIGLAGLYVNSLNEAPVEKEAVILNSDTSTQFAKEIMKDDKYASVNKFGNTISVQVHGGRLSRDYRKNYQVNEDKIKSEIAEIAKENNYEYYMISLEIL